MIYMLRKENEKKEWILLSIIYCLSQGMLLLVTGRWWDDWVLYGMPESAMWDMFLELGRPASYWIVKLTKALSEPGYRILTFILFYFCMLSVYHILRTWLNLPSQSCFWISAVYATIPANDARIMLCVFPYSVGLFFFMIGLSNLADLLYEGHTNRRRRCLNIAFFLLSFILNSNLCFYSVVLLMIIMKEKKFTAIWKYVDYILAPIVFFITKSVCFPAHGGYEGYNAVTAGGLIKAFFHFIPGIFYVMMDISANFLGVRKRYIIFIGIILLTAYCLLNAKKIMQYRSRNIKKKDWWRKWIKETYRERQEDIQILIFGVIILAAGIFAYVAVRGSWEIGTTGLGGRDATLAAFGASMIYYGLIRLFLWKRATTVCLTGVVVGGLLFFNRYYLSYQQDYYRQLGFQYQLAENPELKELNNIVYLNSDETLVEIQRFYVLNANADVAYGNQKRFIMAGFSDTEYLQKEEALSYFVESKVYHMSDYDKSNKRIDAVIDYSFDSDIMDTVQIKFYELFHHERFEECIKNRSSIQVMPDGTEEYEEILLENGYENIEL